MLTQPWAWQCFTTFKTCKCGYIFDYLRLSTSINTCDTVHENLGKQLMKCS